MDEVLANRLIEYAGCVPGTTYGKKGCGYIKKKVGGFNQAAENINYLTLVAFMDTGLSCPPEILSNWLPYPKPGMLLRAVVNELESWLLADRSSLAQFLKINIERIPLDPEAADDPKQTLVNLARKSRSSKIRSALVPDHGSTSSVGKLYPTEMMKYIQDIWDINLAREIAPSLDRCLIRLGELKTLRSQEA